MSGARWCLELAENCSDSFRETFAETCKQVAYLDDLERLLSVPRFHDSVGLSMRLPAHVYYMSGLLWQSTNDDEGISYIVRLANRACDIHDNTAEILHASVRNLIHRVQEAPSPLQPCGQGSALGAFDPRNIALHLERRAMVYDLISMIAHKKPIVVLWEAARHGDPQAFVDLVRIDKSALLAEEFAHYLIDGQHDADWIFFKKLGDAIRNHPVRGRAFPMTSVILTARFWDEEFHDWPHADLVRFLIDQGVLPRTASGHGSYLRTIAALGLRKRRGRPKKRR